ncbi:unnamed protein product [Calicophoron daubneyi]|uniref:Lysosome-associated membrane glycoprotein 1 n=1 Tax=Calicophoron daubneyi TaxID=300641 RepID=A0AAV2T821_CALDB
MSLALVLAVLILVLCSQNALAGPVYDVTGEGCKNRLLATFDVDFTVEYEDQNDKKLTKKFKNVTSVDHAGNCQADTNATLTVFFKPEKAVKNWTLNLMVVNGSYSKKINVFYTQSVSLSYHVEKSVFGDCKEEEITKIADKLEEFSSDFDSNFRCNSEKELRLGSKAETKVFMHNLKIELMPKERTDFSKKETLCTADVPTDNTIPIAVGVALIVCIVVALVVFIIFNRRNRRRFTSV